jgi:hypothetical protein
VQGSLQKGTELSIFCSGTKRTGMVLARFAPVLSSICACLGSGRMRMLQLEMYALVGTQEIGGEERNQAIWDAFYIRSPSSELPVSVSAMIVFTIALELPSLRRCFHILVSTRSQESRGRLPLHAGERFDGEYRLLTGEDSDTMQPLGACLLHQPFATRNLKTSSPHTSATRGLMLLYCAFSARTSYMRVAKISTSVDAVLREGISQKRPIPADIPINIPRSYSHPSQIFIRFTYRPPRKRALCSQLRSRMSHAERQFSASSEGQLAHHRIHISHSLPCYLQPGC